MNIGDWKLDGYYQYGRTDSNIDMDKRDPARSHLPGDRCGERPGGGKIVCNSTLMYPGNGCVPLNVFGVGSPSQAAIDWIAIRN